MNMVIPNEGKTVALNTELNSGSTASETWHVRLFKNNYTPVDGSVLADFTEATFTGYAQVDVAPSDWGAATIVADVAESTSAVTPTYTCTGGSTQDVYGWYAVGATSNKVRAAQKFNTARSMSAGATEALDPFKIKLKTFA
jgi:hypothetical protein